MGELLLAALVWQRCSEYYWDRHVDKNDNVMLECETKRTQQERLLVECEIRGPLEPPHSLLPWRRGLRKYPRQCVS